MRDALFIYLVSYTLLSILHVHLYLLMGLIKSKTFLKKGTEMRSDEDEERSESRGRWGGMRGASLAPGCISLGFEEPSGKINF